MRPQDQASRRAFLRGTGRAVAAAWAFPALLTACAGNEEPTAAAPAGGDAGATGAPGTKVVGFDHPFNTIPFWTPIMAWAERAASARGYEMLRTADNGVLETQVANLEAWIAQGVPAMTVFPIENSTIEGIAQRARDAGIIWVTYGQNMDNEDGAVLLNNVESGSALGSTAADWVLRTQGGRAKVIQLTFPDGGQIGRERDQGAMDAFLEKVPDAEVVAQQKAVDQETGLNVVGSVLAANPDVNVVLGINDDGALGAYQAFLDRGHAANGPDVFIGGQDGAQPALELVKQDTMYRCSVALRISDLGGACIEHPIDLLEGAASGDRNVPIKALTIADADTIDDYLGELDV